MYSQGQTKYASTNITNHSILFITDSIIDNRHFNSLIADLLIPISKLEGRSHPALTRVQRPTPSMFFVPRDLDVWPKINGLKGFMVDHVSVKFNLVILAAFFEISCGKTDRQTSVRCYWRYVVEEGRQRRHGVVTDVLELQQQFLAHLLLDQDDCQLVVIFNRRHKVAVVRVRQMQPYVCQFVSI